MFAPPEPMNVVPEKWAQFLPSHAPLHHPHKAVSLEVLAVSSRKPPVASG